MPNRLQNSLRTHKINAARHAAEVKSKERREAMAAGPKSKKRSQPNKPTSPGTTINGKSHHSVTESKPKKARPPTIPFDHLDTILLLGEANFSFTQSLIQPPHNHSPHLILATSYDSEKVCYEKYEDAKGIVEKLRERGVKVAFGVDAGDLGKSKVVGKGRRWSKVIFNFPHVGEYIPPI